MKQISNDLYYLTSEVLGPKGFHIQVSLDESAFAFRYGDNDAETLYILKQDPNDESAHEREWNNPYIMYHVPAGFGMNNGNRLFADTLDEVAEFMKGIE